MKHREAWNAAVRGVTESQAWLNGEQKQKQQWKRRVINFSNSSWEKKAQHDVCGCACVCVCVCVLMWSPINFDITDNKINIISLFSKFTVLFDVVIHLNNYLVRFCSLIGTKPIRNNPYDHYSLEESWYILSRSLGTKISQLYLSPLPIRSKE